MHCLSCRGPLEYVQEVAYARCTHCLALYRVQSPPMRARFLEPMNVPPADLERVATELGFAKREANYSVVGVGGVNVKIGTGKMVRDVKTKVSAYLWGLVFGGILLLVLAGIFIVVIVMAMGGSNSSSAATPKAPKDTSWDGKSTLVCATGDAMRVSNVTASIASGVAVKASGNCVLELVGVNLSAPVAIDASANAKVSLRGGSVKGATHSIVAGGNASVDVQGVALIGPTKRTGNAKLVGVP